MKNAMEVSFSRLYQQEKVIYLAMSKENKIQVLTFMYSIAAIHLYKRLIEQKEFIISRQFLKSATSVGANIEEAIAAQSRRDFISKMMIARKEARESKYWLRLMMEGSLVEIDCIDEMNQVDHIINMLTKIIKSSLVNS